MYAMGVDPFGSAFARKTPSTYIVYTVLQPWNLMVHICKMFAVICCKVIGTTFD